MCGIIGQISFKGSNATHPPLSMLNHRGPDGSGEWKNDVGNVYLGHTRLAILEPTPAGYQPMIDASKRFTITFNGEIYNHLELRPLLPLHTWNGSSDTETLLELLSFKGLDALHLLKGMFAFALYDNIEDSLLLVRDRLGIKPLWIKSHYGCVSFSSEVRPLLGTDEVHFTKHALSEYIGFGHIPGSSQVFKGIESLLPGTWTKIYGSGKMKNGNWWPTPNFTAGPKLHNLTDSVARVNKLVTKAIEEHLISDVGVGAFLSGGIDSSIVTLVAGKALGKKLQTFTVGFPQGDYDERMIARRVAEKAGSEHFELEVTKEDCLTAVKEAVEGLDLPSVDAINTYIVSKAVRELGLKVALSGLGGDELFGGYPSFKSVPLLQYLNLFPTLFSKGLVKLMPGNLREKLRGINGFSAIDLTVARRRFVSTPQLKSMGISNGIPHILQAPTGLDTMGKISWAEMQGYMIPMLLRDSDQMSMSVGLEIRVPFLDHLLVEEVISMPAKFKKGKGVKPLLVEAFRDVLPNEVYNRPKQGFELPMDDWIRGPLREFTKQGINAAAEFTNIREPLLQMEIFESGKLHWTRVWKWSVLGHWLARQNVRNDVEALAEMEK